MASRPQRKKQYLAQQAGEQKELQQPDAEKVVQSVSVQEQSVHIGPLPPADEARKYQEIYPDFMDRTLALTERLQKADIEITKREQSFRAAQSILSLLVAGGIVFMAIFWAYKILMAGHGTLASFVPFVGALTALAGAFYGKKKINEQSNPQRKNLEKD